MAVKFKNVFPIFLVLSVSGLAEADVSPFVGFQVVNDDNLYRIDSGATLPTDLSKSDQINQLSAGLDVDLDVSRQSFLLNAKIVDTRFEKNDQLDYVGKNVKGTWQWKAGSHVFGVVSIGQDVTLSDFSTSTVLQKSERTELTQALSVNWRYHPDYQVGVFVQNYDSSYDLAARKTSDREQVNASLNWVYLANSGSKIGLQYQNLDGENPNRELNVNSTIDNEYKQESLMVTVLWNASVKSKLSGEFGVINRTNPNISGRDYDGVNLDFAYDWFPTGKLGLNVEAFRKVVSSDDLLASYSENTGLAVNANWLWSDKVRLTASWTNESRDFVGIDDVTTSLPELDERYVSQTLGVGYRPNRNVDVSLSLSNMLRDSNRALRDYESNMVALNLIVNL